MLRKFVRKLDTRIKRSEIIQSNQFLFKKNNSSFKHSVINFENQDKDIYSKRWKEIFSKLDHENDQTNFNKRELKGLLNNFYKNALTNNNKKNNINYSEQSNKRIIGFENLTQDAGATTLIYSLMNLYALEVLFFVKITT